MDYKDIPVHSEDKTKEFFKRREDYTIIGESKEIIEVLDIAKKMALSDASILIYGESGAGKELLARFIQRNSQRKEERFVAINCAAIPNELLENELFGHKKGAFTGVQNDYIGKFGYANGGTLFLDEIGELTISLQAKLLRVLQFKVYEPLGSNESFETNVRIVVSTNKDLLELIRENKFREDLYYRLNVMPITMPPLRTRKSDIEVLANYFLNMYNRKNNKNIHNFAHDVIEVLRDYDWPGNVRELQNVIERAIVFCNGLTIKKEHIIIYKSYIKKEVNGKSKSLKDALTDFKKEFIIEVLEENKWNQTNTARELEIQRTYLARLIKELNISKL